ncbi:GNAT family N-acetyltransferase [Glycomyces arizonensis]|uniref:GNAT family N-acetyltransferase n=1 Tax=Glycomyces arizonensis TaxID=256035 RepID=UPI000427BB67|nr:GNAT family N-acetyltransferase [Glycomyces arizonensis]
MEFASYRDAWGIPHLRARTARALAFAQGRGAAADRAEQIEALRRHAEGTAAARFGREALDWDRFARQARIADTARRCFAALDHGTAAWTAAYVDGVNSLGLRWEPWTPLAVWLSEHLLFGAGFPAKLWRERLAVHLGEDAIALFATDGSDRSGSNGWLLTGERTASGRSLLAGDPHRHIEEPGIYQQIRLSCDEFDVVGLAVPGVPGIAHFGHTGGVAWGITNAMADTTDLYWERLRHNGDRIEALGPDGWETADARTETIEVAGESSETVDVLETPRGPVIAGGLDDGWALSLRCPVRARNDLGFGALPKLLRAWTVDDVDAALDEWVTPVNVVLAADTAGGHLHRVAGRVPVRDKANLLRPVPAWKARHAWHGWHEPPRGAIRPVTVMANQAGPSAPLGVEFAPPHRARRIAQLLTASRAWTAETVGTVHTDALLPSAGPLLDALAALDGLSCTAAALRKRLLAWDRRMDAASAEAADYAALRAAVVRRLAEHPALAPLAEPSPYPELFAPWLALRPRIAFALEHLLSHDGPIPAADLADAVRAAVEATAPDSGLTPWGERHRLAPWLSPPGETWPGLPGDHDCVLSTTSVPGTTDTFARGPAARWVWDLADRSRSRWIVPLGAAGEPGHPHARDQLPLWSAGELIPVTTDWNDLNEESPMTDHATGPAERAAVHEQTVPGFGRVRIVPVDPKADIDLIHGWVTEDRARFWGMLEASRERVLEIYEYLDSLATHHAFLVLRDGAPIALFQTYEPDADPVGERYEVLPGDIGTHLLVARPDRGGAQAGFTAALVSVLAAYLFADPAHRRIVVEPDARNEQARARLRRTGFALGPEIELPGKRARLAFLTREAHEGGRAA